MTPGTAVTTPTDRALPTSHVGQLEPNHFCRAWNAKRQKYCSARAGAGTKHPGSGRCRYHGGLQEGDRRLRSGRYSLLTSESIGQLVEQFAADPDPLNVLPDLAVARALLTDFLNRYGEFAPALIAWHDTWEGKYLPLSEEAKRALIDSLDELEARVRDEGETDTEFVQQLGRAREAVAFLSVPQNPKPRVILDLSDAVRHVDVISKVIDRVERASAANAVSRPELLRIMSEMGRVVEAHVPDPDQRRRIRDGWLAIRL